MANQFRFWNQNGFAKCIYAPGGLMFCLYTWMLGWFCLCRKCSRNEEMNHFCHIYHDYVVVSKIVVYPYLGSQIIQFDEAYFWNGLELPTRLYIKWYTNSISSINLYSAQTPQQQLPWKLHQDQALGPQQILAMLSGQAMCYLCVGPGMTSNMTLCVTFLLGLIMLTQPGWPTDLNFLGITYLVGKQQV